MQKHETRKVSSIRPKDQRTVITSDHSLDWFRAAASKFQRLAGLLTTTRTVYYQPCLMSVHEGQAIRRRMRGSRGLQYSELRTLVKHPNNSYAQSRRQFRPAKCKVLLQVCMKCNKNSTTADQPGDMLDKLICLDNCIHPEALAEDEVTHRIGNDEEAYSTFGICGFA
ncbi:hypothetical protein CLF_107421 [Clonorchis sinensis]|uniref:Uncharacterized protein n=1 Tax=Clonorchis sinensis TaxID=79923 RepID=G7YGS3_CLOSI|nr:hypothetical protein CLF_107421 [Clonorchis sinensis]